MNDAVTSTIENEKLQTSRRRYIHVYIHTNICMHTSNTLPCIWMLQIVYFLLDKQRATLVLVQRSVCSPCWATRCVLQLLWSQEQRVHYQSIISIHFFVTASESCRRLRGLGVPILPQIDRSCTFAPNRFSTIFRDVYHCRCL